jgi:hypothetical protein
MSYAHLRTSDDGQITVIREIYAGYVLTHGPSTAAALTRLALLTLGWDSAEARDGARLAEAREHIERIRAEWPVEIVPEHRDKL